MENIVRSGRLGLIGVLLLFGHWGYSQQIGANFNENIDEIDGQLLKHADVQWVRGFVNVPRFFLNIKDGEIIGVKQKAIENFERIDPFLAAKSGEKKKKAVKLIMSLKTDFKFKNVGVPEVNTQEMAFLMLAIEKFLVTKQLGKQLSILVLGNEPMWETPNEDAEKYGVFLDLLANKVVEWKRQYAWDFDVFGGSLNRAGQLQRNPILKEVVRVVKNNDNIVGIDLHTHAQEISQIENDLAFVRKKHQIKKKIISTEFSMVRLFELHREDLIGQWGIENGYDANMKLYELINAFIGKASMGEPVDKEVFYSYFKAQSWYPEGWFTIFYDAFKKYDASVVTYRLHSGIDRSPRLLKSESALWLLNPLFCGRLLGEGENGFYETNPLVFPEFDSVPEK